MSFRRKGEQSTEHWVNRRLRRDPAFRRPEELLSSGVVLGRRPKPWPKTGPSEASEHLRFAAGLRHAGIHFLHTPMGGARGRHSGRGAARMGARKGFPDFLVLDTPPASVCASSCGYGFDTCETCDLYPVHGRPGLAMELKRPVLGSRVTEDQLRELVLLVERDWYGCVEWGADEASRRMRQQGYSI